MKEIAKALLSAQMEMGNAIKDSKNPFFKSKYADLNSVREACLPQLNKNGIVVLQPIVNVDGKNFVKTVLLHESGQSLESFTEIIYSKQNDAQAQGSGITYARRYGLQSFVNIGADDDDGNMASTPPKTQINEEPNLNGMKPKLTDTNYKAVYSRLEKGETAVYQKTIDTYYLNPTQKKQLDDLWHEIQTELNFKK